MRGEPTVLLTGFEPFGDWTRNVSGEAVRTLDGRRLEGVRVVACVLPVAWPRAIRVLEKALAKHRPDAVVAFGIHGQRRRAFRVESIGVNELDFRIADNDGKKRRGKIDAKGPRLRRSTLSTTALVRALRESGLSARPSKDAGRFLCNAVFYWLLGRVALGTFVHVPPRLPEDSSKDIIIAARAAALVAVRALARHQVEA